MAMEGKRDILVLAGEPHPLLLQANISDVA